MHLNPNLFFLLKEGALYVWDYKAHQQYEIDISTLENLISISKTGQETDVSQKDDLEIAGLVANQPYTTQPWTWDVLSHIFHVGTQNIGDSSYISTDAWVQAHLDYSLSVDLTSEDLFYSIEGPKIPLDHTLLALEKISFKHVLMSRKTSRQFQKKTVNFTTVSTLIYACFGTVHEDFRGNNPYYVGLRKTSPSTGGLHPSECFLLAWAVEGLTPGIYHYDVKTNHLTYCSANITHQELKDLFYGQPYMDDCAFGIFLASRFHIVWKKYPHSRSYRDSLIDIGLVSQTTLLTATALGLLTWESGLFNDKDVSRCLNINGEDFAPLFFMAFGY